MVLLAFVLLGVGYLLWRSQQQINALKEDLITLKEVEEILITKAALQSREEERQRLAKDWHDGIGNVICTARFLTDNIQTEDKAALKEVQNLLENAHIASKSIISDLRTTNFHSYQEVLPYLEKLQQQLSFGNVALKYELNAQHSFSQLNEEKKWHFYNIMQELFANIIKHASATMVHLQLLEDKGRLCLTVIDDGNGFDSSIITPKTIQERVNLLDGELKIQQNAPKGTKVVIRF